MKTYQGDIYDAMYADYREDIPFYQEFAREAGEVLEIAIGTGRVGIYLANKENVDIWGIDINPTMLKRARKKLSLLSERTETRVVLKQGDMRNFDLEREFKLIIVPFRAFQSLLTCDDQRAALKCFYQHLKDEGILIVDLWDPNYRYLSPETKNIRGPIISKIKKFKHPANSNQVIVTGFRENHPEKQTFREVWRFEEIDPGGEVVNQWYQKLNLRWTFRFEMQHLIELCDFEVVNLYGDFLKGPFKYGGEQIWVLEKAK